MPDEKYKPRYVMFWLGDFYADPRVSRRLDWVERHLYLMLCLQAHYCRTRPYLPCQDADLALLADCPVEIWLQHRENVLAMFKEYTGDEGEVLGYSTDRILADWEKEVAKHHEYVNQGRKGGLAKAKRRLSTETDTEPDETEPNGTKRDETKQNKTETRQQVGSQSSAASSSVSSDEDDLDQQPEQYQGRLDHDGRETPWALWLSYAESEELAHKHGYMLMPRTAGDGSRLSVLKADKQTLKSVIRWMFVTSDYWARPGKGELKGVHGFVNAFPKILEQYNNYVSKAKSRKAGN